MENLDKTIDIQLVIRKRKRPKRRKQGHVSKHTHSGGSSPDEQRHPKSCSRRSRKWLDHTHFRFLGNGFEEESIAAELDLFPGIIPSTSFESWRHSFGDQETDTSRENKHIECDKITQQDRDGDCILFISIICARRDLSIALVNLLCSSSYLQVTNKLFQTALHLATIIGDHVIVRRLMVGGIEVERKDRHGDTALHIACDRGFLKIARELLKPISHSEVVVNKYKAPFRRIPQNLELRNNDGLTCLHVAAKRKDLAIIELLLSKNADVNAKRMKDGKTILHYFCEIGEHELVRWLLKRDSVDFNARTYSGTTAADIAKGRGHSFIVSLLLYAGANHNSQSVGSSEEISESDSD